MKVKYLVIDCPAEAVENALATFKDHPFVYLTMPDSPSRNYLCLSQPADAEWFRDFARKSGFRCNDISPAAIRRKHIETGSFVMAGMLSLVPWLGLLA